MAKPSSKKHPKSKSKKPTPKVFIVIAKPFKKLIRKIHDLREPHLHLHKSFRRSYREDYVRETPTPGILTHIMTTFGLIKKHWKTFLPLILVMTVCYIVLVGLMSEEFYQQYQSTIEETRAELGGRELSDFARAGLLLLSTVTSGGLDLGTDEVGTVFIVILFLILWLVTVFLVRHYLTGSKPKLRDAFYNALTPLISTLIVFAVIFIQLLPATLVVITYSAAVNTGFLSTPFYALVYFIFAALMILLTAYLLSSSLIALAAVTAPGVYPMSALAAASDLIAGRRLRFVARLIALVLTIAVIYIVCLLPVILIDLWLKDAISWLAGWPIVPYFLLLVTCFVFVYLTAYIYRYYRWLLEYQEK